MDLLTSAEIRHLIRQALKLGISQKGLLWLVGSTDPSLSMKASALSQQLGGTSVNFSPLNAEVWTRFFRRNAIGRALAEGQVADSANIADEALDTLFLSRAPIDISGLYFVYHGSFLYKDKFVARLMNIQRLAGGNHFFKEYLQDAPAAKKPSDHKSLGFVVFREADPHFLCWHEEPNSLGMRLIIGHRPFKVGDDIPWISGTMCGYSNSRASYSRHVHLKRVGPASESAFDARKVETTVDSFDNLSSFHKSGVLELIENRVMQKCVLDAADTFRPPRNRVRRGKK